MNFDSNIKTSAACFGGGLASGFLICKILDKLRSANMNETLPDKWVRVGTISQLIIYPVKSLPGINVQEATVTSLGLVDSANPTLRDRVFLVTNKKLDFKTLRQIPSLALIQVTVQYDTITFRVDNKPDESISIPIPEVSGVNPIVIARVWEDKVKVVDCGDKVSQWLTKVTESKEPLRLVFNAVEGTQRTVAASQKLFPRFSTKDLGTFQDETSYMVMSDESLAALNSKCNGNFTARSFRPNIVVTGTCEPWAEDFWTFVRIGKEPTESPILKVAKPCERCKLTTVDPDTGKVREDGEPLATLKSIKREQIGDELVTKLVKNSAIMGNSFGLFKGDDLQVRVGDPVYAALL